MKKIIKYISVFLLFIFVFAYKSTVYADLKCEGSMKIREVTMASSTGWKTVIPVCGNYKFDHYIPIDQAGNYPDARAIGEELIRRFYRTVDGKTTVARTVPRCTDKMAYINMELTYAISYAADKEYGEKDDPKTAYTCWDYSKELKSDPCSSYNKKETCIKDTTYKCLWKPLKVLDDPENPLTPSKISTIAFADGKCESELDLKSYPNKDHWGKYYGTKTCYSGKTTDYDVIKKYYCKETGFTIGDKDKGEDPHRCYKYKTIKDGADLEYNDCYDDNYYFAYDEENNPIGCKKITTEAHKAEKERQRYEVSRDVEAVIKRNVAKCNSDYEGKACRTTCNPRYVVLLDDGNIELGRGGCVRICKDSKYKCESYGGSANFTFYCPAYKCDVWDEEIHTCTPEFTIGNDKAYCVNPSNPFSSTASEYEDYKPDPKFNVAECDSSFSTVDCGYANILIEGNYYESKHPGSDISDSIELAMRLWGAHTGRAGFNSGTGLSNRKNSDCQTSVYYMARDNKIYNVYKQTYNYVMKYFFNDIFEKITEGNLSFSVDSTYDFDVVCPDRETFYDTEGTDTENILDIIMKEYNDSKNSEKYAVACRGKNSEVSSGKTFQRATALLFNTITGNKKMQEHLTELSGFDADNEPYYFDYSTSNSKNIAIVRYKSYDFEEVFRKTNQERIKCDESDPIFKKFKEDIAPFCKTQIDFYNKMGEKIESLRVEECQKSFGCYSETKLTEALCTVDREERVPTHVVVKYEKSRRVDSVKKFVACGSTDNQNMFAYFDYDEDDTSTDTGWKTNLNIIKNPGEKTFTIMGVYCENDEHCPRADVISSINNTCSNDDNNFDKTFDSYVKDPSLRCIVNLKNDGDKAMYEYSEKFHVNRDLCRIYCSDEVDYYIADKVKQNSDTNNNSGRFFKYNIKVSGSGFEHSDKLFSSIIKEKRTCVSEIYYSKPIPSDSIQNLRRIYGLKAPIISNSDINRLADRKNISAKDARNLLLADEIARGALADNANWTNLFSALLKKVKGYNFVNAFGTREKDDGENSRGEVLNQIIYDLMNCNLYKENQFVMKVKEGNREVNEPIRKPSNNEYGNVRKYIDVEYGSSNSYGLYILDTNANCSIDESTGKNTCMVHAPLEYSFGAKTQGNKAEFNTNTTMYTSFIGDGKDVYYCSGTNCFNYSQSYNKTGKTYAEILDIAKEEYVYGNSNKANRTGAFVIRNVNIGYHEDDVTYTIQLPINDYAYFDISTEVGFYNKSRYQIAPLTGNVILKTAGKKYMDLPEYSFPISYYAYNMKSPSNRISESYPCFKYNKDTTRCNVTQSLSSMATFFRNNTADVFTNSVKELRKFQCYVDVKKPDIETCQSLNDPLEVAKCTFYESVDAKDIFPEEVRSYTVPENWQTAEAKKAIEFIEQTSNKLIGKDDTLLDYRITLNPAQINALKKYNKEAVPYNNEPIIESTCKTDKPLSSNPSVYLNCESKLLHDIRTKKLDGLFGFEVDNYLRPQLNLDTIKNNE